MPLTTVDQGLLGTYAQYTGFKNRIINGDMLISQRGTTFSSGIGALTYTLDRWTVAAAGAAVSVSAAQDGASPYTSYMSITGAAGNTLVGIRQRIEWLNTKDLAGQNVTVSLYCYNATSNATSATVQLDFPTAKDNYTSTTSTATQAITLSNTTGVQTFTFAVPAAGANGIQLTVFVSNLTSGVLVFRQVQLEAGSTATSFDRRDYGRELMMCQRYFSQLNYAGSLSFWLTGYAQANEYLQSQLTLPVPMRVQPVLSTNVALTIVNTLAPDIQPTGVQTLFVRIRAIGTGTVYTYNPSAFQISASAEL